MTASSRSSAPSGGFHPPRLGAAPRHEHRWSKPYNSLLVGLDDPLVRRCLDCGWIEHVDG